MAKELSVGFVVCDPSRPVHTVTAFEAELVILDYKNIITAGFSCVMHAHSAIEEIKLTVR